MSLPAIELLAERGLQPWLVGKAWLEPLMRNYRDRGWQIHAYPAGFAARVRLLRLLTTRAKAQDREFLRRQNTLLFTNSFSSALEARCAGLRTLGFSADGRRWLLTQHLRRLPERHQVDRFWSLAQHFVGAPPSRPQDPRYVPEPAAHGIAQGLLQQHGLNEPFVVVVPFAAGLSLGQSRLWPHFSALVATLVARNERVVVCPGNASELAVTRAELPGVTVLEGVGLSAYAALMQSAKAVIANDTGPGHLAAAVGAKVITVFGPSNPAETSPRGQRVIQMAIMRHEGANIVWPTPTDVLAKIPV